jgi:guanosine-3',5'-bis(diphosphate) 3'-pyrophosphohydrolase
MESTIDKIIAFADHAHGDQKRKYSDERYIVHPVRVMETCRELSDDISILAAALLHDVLEDTQTTEEEIEQFLSGVLKEDQVKRTLQYVRELTDIYTKKNYPRFNRAERKRREADRLSEVSAEAQTIKYADLIDNAVNIAEHDPDFGPKFLREGEALLQKINKGDPQLYQKAGAIISQGTVQLQKRHPADQQP